jgi:hypothetical protein
VLAEESVGRLRRVKAREDLVSLSKVGRRRSARVQRLYERGGLIASNTTASGASSAMPAGAKLSMFVTWRSVAAIQGEYRPTPPFLNRTKLGRAWESLPAS